MTRYRTVAVPTRGRRHPMTVVTQARRYRDTGSLPSEIVRFFAEDGVTVSLRSVIRWTEPKVVKADRKRELARRRRDASRRSGRLGLHITNPTDEFKFARVRALREAGLEPLAIAQVMRFDFGDPLTQRQVVHALRLGRYPKRTR